MIKAIIFDLDQTLINSVDQTLAYYKYLFEYFNIKFPIKKKQRAFYTKSALDNYNTFLKKEVKLKEFLAYREKLTNNYSKYLKLIKLSKNAKEILKFIKKNKIKLAIVTNRGTTIFDILKYFRLEHYFDIVIGENKDFKKNKPYAYPINIVLKKFKVKKNEVLYIGDDIVDIQACTNAKIKIALYSNKFRGANYYIKDLIEVKKIIGLENGQKH
jgi:phosphoglycolate phosphatase